MKKLILIIALVVTGLTVKAQDVPADISSSLNEKYPEAKKVDWERDGVNYKAEFSIGKKDYDVLFDSKGQWISTDIDHLKPNELPGQIQKGLDNSKYNNWEVGGVEMTETPDAMTYKVEVRRGMSMRDLYFDDDGNLIRDKSKI